MHWRSPQSGWRKPRELQLSAAGHGIDVSMKAVGRYSNSDGLLASPVKVLATAGAAVTGYAGAWTEAAGSTAEKVSWLPGANATGQVVSAAGQALQQQAVQLQTGYTWAADAGHNRAAGAQALLGGELENPCKLRPLP